jgi:phosphoglycolate phosphatase-like HAD superfamily hydrolase
VAHRAKTAFIFDLDGTLVDSVYQHVLAWQEALTSENIELSVWRIHRKIGMSGGFFTNMLLRETGTQFDVGRIERVQRAHAEAYRRNLTNVRPLPGARDLLTALRSVSIPFAIATSSHMEPEPDLFLAAAERLQIGAEGASVVGDSVWDMLAATRGRFLGIGLLSGGYGREELECSGAYRVFDDPADLLTHLDEVGGRR